MASYPQANLPTESTRWGVAMQGDMVELRREAERSAQANLNANKQGQSSMGLLSQQVSTLTQQQGLLQSQQAELTEQQAVLAEQVATLNALASVSYAETTDGVTGFTGFYSGPVPTVTATSPTGRLEVGFGGSLNGGNGYFCYSITGATSGSVVSRTAVQANPARRVAVSGGAAFAPSGYKTVIETVPKDEGLTVKVEFYASDNYVYFFGGSIMARVAP